MHISRTESARSCCLRVHAGHRHDRRIGSWQHSVRVAFFSLICLSWLGSCSNRTELDESVSQLTLKTLSGDAFVVADAPGPLLVNFWSTSCVICVAEMPEMARLHEDYVDRGLSLVAIAMPYDPPNHVLEMARDRQFPFTVALDIQSEAVAAFGNIKGTPTSFLLDAEGKLVQRYVGAIPFDGLRARLDKMLGVS